MTQCNYLLSREEDANPQCEPTTCNQFLNIILLIYTAQKIIVYLEIILYPLCVSIYHVTYVT